MTETAAIRNEFFVPDFKVDELRTKFARLNRKAQKCGTSPILLVVDEATTEDRVVGYIPDSIDPHKSNPVTARFVRIVVTGDQPKINGWRLIARLMFEDAALPIIASVPGEALPERFRSIGKVCEHCAKIRDRKDTFVVGHDNGDYKAVGSSCLADFLGHADPKLLAELAELYTALGGMEWNPDSDDFDDLMGGFSRGVIRVPLDYVVSLARVYSESFGWVTAKRASETGESPSTGILTQLAFNRRNLTPRMREIADACTITDADETWAKEAIAWAAGMNAGSDFEHNLKAIAMTGSVTNRTFGFACAIVGAYRRHVEGEAEKSHNRATTVHVGVIGDRTIFDLYLVSVREFPGQFGVRSLYRFNDEEGNTLVWWTNTSGKDLPEGEWCRVKATVKAHGEYRGFKQTELSRIDRLPTAEEQAKLDTLSDDAKRAVIWAYNPSNCSPYLIGRWLAKADINGRPEEQVGGAGYATHRKPVSVTDFYTDADEASSVVIELLALGWVEEVEGRIDNWTATGCKFSDPWSADWRPDPANPFLIWGNLPETFIGYRLLDDVPAHLLGAVKPPKARKARKGKATA